MLVLFKICLISIALGIFLLICLSLFIGGSIVYSWFIKE